MVESRDLLSHVSLFRGVDRPSLQELSKCLTPHAFQKDDVVFNRDDPGDAMFIIETGRVKVLIEGENGREVILSTFRANDFFGEMSLLDGMPRSATVVALEPSRLWVLERKDFVRHLNDFPNTALNVLSELSQRLRRADGVIGNLALLDVYNRVAKALVELGRRDGEETDDGVLIRERPTQQDLASMVGTSRETVSRVLGELQRQGHLQMQGKALLLIRGFMEHPAAHDTSAAASA